MRLIDADALQTHEQVESLGNGKYEYVEVVYKDDIDAMPTIEERKTGKWILDSKPGRYRCSECLAFSARDDLGNEYLSDYCSVCGADMRGEP